MKPYPNEELERMSKREIIRLYKRTVEQFSDAVPVIRCRDCKHYFPEGHVRCWNIRGMHYPVEPDEFCSRAERRENET